MLFITTTTKSGHRYIAAASPLTGACGDCGAATGTNGNKSPNKKCCTTTNLCKTSAKYIFINPVFTLPHSVTPLMSYRRGECSAKMPRFI